MVVVIVVAIAMVIMVLMVMVVIAVTMRSVTSSRRMMALAPVGMAATGIGAAFGIERRLDLDPRAPNPLTIASMTWSRRIRSPLGMICVGRWRLPRCQARRTR